MLKSVMAHYDGSNYITDGNLSVSATLDSLTGILKGSDFTSIKEIKEARIAERYGHL